MVVGEFTQDTELVVIGGGPAGYAAAFRAAELGIATVIVDQRAQLGGVCLHEGCIPSKTLLNLVESLRHASRAETYGVSFGTPTIDIDRTRRWVESTIESLSKSLNARAGKLDVELIQGDAMFDDSRSITVTNGSVMHIRFRRAIIATGSIPIENPALPWNGSSVLSPRQAIRIPHVPESMLVIGDGYMMLEIGCIYAALGTEVTLVSEGDSHLPGADDDLVRVLIRSMKSTFESMHTNVDITDASIDRDGCNVTFGGKSVPDRRQFDAVVVSRGQRPNVDALRLERASIATDEDGRIIIDEQCKTNNPRILAAGDVTGGLMFANIALQRGRIAAEIVAGWNSAYDAQVCPVTVFTDPNVAWCGLTETEAAAAARDVGIAKVPWTASGRMTGMGRRDGVTKLIYDKPTGLVLGIGLVGPHAAEMISEAALAVEMGATLTDLSVTLHPHPSTSELLSDIATSELPDES